MLSPAPIVIGVVKDVTQGGVGTVAKPEVYYSQEQDGGAPSTVVARTTGDPVALEASVRKLVLSIDSLQPVRSFTTMDQIVSDSVAPKRFSFVLLAVLAVLAVVLAAIGLYGVMAYLVEQRTREIGIRVALGAEQRGVAWLVVRQAMTLALAGIAVGTASSLAAVRLLRGMVYDVSIYDPWTFAAVAALLGAVALLASYVPARRAARVDPMVALREE